MSPLDEVNYPERTNGVAGANCKLFSKHVFLRSKFRSTSTAGYVTIGSVRYGVRFSSSTSEDGSLPSAGSKSNKRDADEPDYCCEVMQMAWPRSRGSSLPPSKIPLPNADKVQAINKQGKSSEERAAPVYRSTLEVSRSKKAPVGCFAVDSDESSKGDMKASPQTPNSSRRPLFPKPNFKFGNASAGEADTSRLISGSKEDLSGSGNQFQITLDKLQKFRFGSNNNDKSGAPSGGTCQKKKRSSDKAERLRELTDKLLHSRGASATSSDKKKPPAPNPSSPSSRFSNKQVPGPSLRSLFGSTTSLTSCQSKPIAKREASVQSVEGCSSGDTQEFDVKSDECTSGNEDKSDQNVGDSHKADIKPISGIAGYAQRMNAFRSASFSQVDYDTADGKYTRNSRKGGTSPKPGISQLHGCVTFPRVKQVDASTSVSPPPDKVTEKAGSTPSVDSAVGSDEGFAIGSSNNLPLISDSHKPAGARSLTYPFTKKTSKSDEMPFSSVDGNGLKSLQHCPSLNRELSDVKEEVSVSSETPTIADTLSECSNETVREIQLEKTCDNSLSSSANNSPNPRVSPNPDKTVYQCMVKEYPVLVTDALLKASEKSNLEPANETLESLETLEREINELITQQKGNTSPKPEIYITTWPKEAEVKESDTVKPERTKTELLLKCDNNYKESNWKGEDNGKCELSKEQETDESKKTNKRWSSDTSNDGSSEPVSMEDGSMKNQWVRHTDKPKLVCQSSEEKEDEVAPNYRRYQLLNRTDSLSEGDSDQGDRRPSTPLRDRERTCSPSPYAPNYDHSDNESRNGKGPRRYSKRPLRGPYGQMLEAEMKKPDATRLMSKKQLTDDLKFLEEYISPLPEGRTNPSEGNRPSSESRLTCPRPRINAGRSFDDSQLQNVYSTDPRSPTKRKASASLPYGSTVSPQKEGLVVCHQRTTSSPSQLEGFSSGSSSAGSKGSPQPSQELLAALLKGSSERRFVTEDNPLGNAQNSKVSNSYSNSSNCLPDVPEPSLEYSSDRS